MGRKVGVQQTIVVNKVEGCKQPRAEAGPVNNHWTGLDYWTDLPWF